MPFQFFRCDRCGEIAVCLENITGERHRIQGRFEMWEEHKQLVQSEKAVWLQHCGTWLKVDNNADSKNSSQKFHEASRE
jgi:hypothetical protein